MTGFMSSSSSSHPFSPHVTVSYHGDGPIRRALESHEGAPWRVAEFALVRSQNGEYQQLKSWPV